MPVVIPSDQLTPDFSIGVVVALAGLLPLLSAAIALLLSWSKQLRARRADAEHLLSAALEPGADAVLYGAVEPIAGQDEAVRVEVDQMGVERHTKKNGWTHGWTEMERRTTAHPFYVADDRGARIRVEPGEDVRLCDELDRVEQIDPMTRLRIATLEPGEKVYAIGRLERAPDPEAGYRGQGQALVLRPPHDRPMLLSTEPLGDQLRREGGVHKKAMVAFLVLGACLQLASVGYYARRFGGESVTGEVIGKRHYTTSTRNDYWEVTVRLPDGDELDEDVLEGAWRHLSEGDEVAVLDAGFSAQLGDAATVDVGLLVTSLLLWGAVTGIYVLAARLSVPWWDTKVMDGGLEGRLPGTDTQTSGLGDPTSS